MLCILMIFGISGNTFLAEDLGIEEWPFRFCAEMIGHLRIRMVLGAYMWMNCKPSS